MRSALPLALACCVLALIAPMASAAIPVRPVGPTAPLTTITFAPGAGSARVYGVTGRDLWRSDDKGTTWTQLGYSPDSPFHCTFAVSPLDENLMYTGCGGMTRDGGKTWAWVPKLNTTPRIDAAGTLYSNEYNRHGLLYRCTADVSSCSDVSLPNGDLALVDPASSGLLVNGLSRSTNGGTTWSPLAFPGSMVTVDFAFDGRTPRKLLASGRDIDGHPLFAVSPDAGSTWGPSRPVPLPQQFDSASLAQAGGAGARRRVWITTASGTVWTADDGVTFHAAPDAGLPVVDPDDGTHVFTGDYTRLYETRDTGTSWALRNAPQFGYDEFQAFTGSGSTFYVIIANVLWSTSDMGLTWAPVPALADARVTSVLASRDDPRVAYAMGGQAGLAAFWHTVDGGATWKAHPPPPYGTSIDWIQGGHPDWVLVGAEESHDAGAAWTYVDSQNPFGDADHRVTPYRVVDPATGAKFSTSPLAPIAPDGSFKAPCPPGATCTGAPYEGVYEGDLWAAGGHYTFATKLRSGGLWALRDGGRWWRIQVPADAVPTQSYTNTVASPPNALFSVVGHSYVVDHGLLIPLQAPVQPAPVVTPYVGGLHCSTTLAADEADVAYAWRRDGVVIAGQSGADLPATPQIVGRAVTCVTTASNAWGATTATSAPYVGVVAVKSGLKLTGSAASGAILRCSAKVRVSWLRDGRAIAGEHSSTYRVQTRDEGHTLACQSRDADGTLTRSVTVRVPKPRGGAAVVLRP